jgi:hypothetical protein
MPPSKRTSSGKPPRKTSRRRPVTGTPAAMPVAERAELVVVLHDQSGIRVQRQQVASVTGAAHRSLSNLAGRDRVQLKQAFGPEDRVIAQAARVRTRAVGPVPDLSVYYQVDSPPELMAELAEEFNAIDEVAGAYVKPAVELPIIGTPSPAPADAPAVTPNYEARQLYLDPAPIGIDARYAWTWPGGGGSDVHIIDCEQAWRFDHEDLLQQQGGVVTGAASTSQGSIDHGTAVLGEMGGDRNTFGVTGICPFATLSAASWNNQGSATTINNAANRLRPGDFILLEGHRPGPRHDYEVRDDQLGYIAIEWWPDDFAAIQMATSQGIIVVAAAGNGAEDLDDALYDTASTGFPASWTNPFDRTNRDSGAVMVGAGAPPPGTHGVDWGADRSRLDFSNYGALVDAQGWGREVTTTGYGDLQGGTDQRLWYTDGFAGTSSASPIVTGALACLQGALRAGRKPLMTPAQARAWLRSSGSAQQDEGDRPSTQRIGNRPNLRQLLDTHAKPDKETKEMKEYIKDRDKLKVEVKENKEKEVKEGVKDFKEPKEMVEGKQLSDQNKLADIGQEWLFGREVRNVGALEQRLTQVENILTALSHFITQDMRPDLTYSAMSREPDLKNDAEVAKQNKDDKDKEYLAER